MTWLRETNGNIDGSADIGRYDVAEYLAYLAGEGLAGVTRRRKLAAIREFFCYLTTVEAIHTSPVQGIDTPKVGRPGCSRLAHGDANVLLLAANQERPRVRAISMIRSTTARAVGRL